MMWKWYIVACALTGAVVQGQMPSEYPSVDIIQRDCERRGLPSDHLKDVSNNFMVCVASLMDMGFYMERASHDFHSLFNSVCQRSEELTRCIDTMVDQTVMCLDSDVREQMYKQKNFTSEFFDLLCSDINGFANFFSEKNINCWSSDIGDCENGNRTKPAPSHFSTYSSLLRHRCELLRPQVPCVMSAIQGCIADSPRDLHTLQKLVPLVQKYVLCDDIDLGLYYSGMNGTFDVSANMTEYFPEVEETSAHFNTTSSYWRSETADTENVYVTTDRYPDYRVTTGHYPGFRGTTDRYRNSTETYRPYKYSSETYRRYETATPEPMPILYYNRTYTTDEILYTEATTEAVKPRVPEIESKPSKTEPCNNPIKINVETELNSYNRDSNATEPERKNSRTIADILFHIKINN